MSIPRVTVEIRGKSIFKTPMRSATIPVSIAMNIAGTATAAVMTPYYIELMCIAFMI